MVGQNQNQNSLLVKRQTDNTTPGVADSVVLTLGSGHFGGGNTLSRG